MSQEVPLCSVINCPNSYRHKVNSTVFYFVPKDPLRSAKWVDALKGHIYDGSPAVAKMLICKNHFEHDALESDSKKLKIDAVPSIFSSLPRQSRSSLLKNAKFKRNNVEFPYKECNLTTTSVIKKMTDKVINPQIPQKCIIQELNKRSAGKSGNVLGRFTPSAVKNKSDTCRFKKHSLLIPNEEFNKGTEIFTSNNEKGPAFHIPKRYIGSSADFIASTNILQVKREQFEPKNGISESDDNLSFREEEDKVDNKLDLKEEIMDINSDSSSDDESTAIIDTNEGTEHFEKNVQKLKIQKQKLMEKHEKLRIKEQEDSLELQILLEEAKRKKDLQRNPPEQEMEILKKCFSSAQIRLLAGQTKSRWSLDDLAMAYTISSLGTREFYTYLRTNLKYPLPAISNINRCYKSKYRKSNITEKTDKLNVKNIPATEADKEL